MFMFCLQDVAKLRNICYADPKARMGIFPLLHQGLRRGAWHPLARVFLSRPPSPPAEKGMNLCGDRPTSNSGGGQQNGVVRAAQSRRRACP